MFRNNYTLHIKAGYNFKNYTLHIKAGYNFKNEIKIILISRIAFL